MVDRCSNYKLPDDLCSGTVLKIGSKEVQLQDICESCDTEETEMEAADPVKLLSLKAPMKLVSKPFMNPCAPGTYAPVDRGNRDSAKPLFDPNGPGAFVLPEPERDHQVN